MATAQLTAPATEKRLTPDEFVQLKIKYAELVDGKVVKKMPTMLSHDRLAFIIAKKLDEWVEQHRLGMVATGGSFRTGENQVRVPDVSFTSAQIWRERTPAATFKKRRT